VPTFARLLLAICVVIATYAPVAGSHASEADQPQNQPSSAPAAAAAQAATAAPAEPRAIQANAPEGPPGPRPDAAAQSRVSTSVSVTAVRPTVLVDETINDAQLRQLLARGYRPETQADNKEIYYCRREADMGSRFTKRVCKTALHIFADEQDGKEDLTRLQVGGLQTGK
jgi:hypothetical protein